MHVVDDNRGHSDHIAGYCIGGVGLGHNGPAILHVCPPRFPLIRKGEHDALEESEQEVDVRGSGDVDRNVVARARAVVLPQRYVADSRSAVSKQSPKAQLRGNSKGPNSRLALQQDRIPRSYHWLILGTLGLRSLLNPPPLRQKKPRNDLNCEPL